MTAARSSRAAVKKRKPALTIAGQREVEHEKLRGHYDHLQRRITAAYQGAGLTVPRPNVTDYHETAHNLDHFARICAHALHTAREQEAEIARLKLLLDAQATSAIDAQLLELLSHVSMHDRVDRVLMVHGPDHGRGIWVDLCVKQDSTVIPYKRARFGASTLHEAIAALLHDIDPRVDIAGMCDGLRHLHGMARAGLSRLTENRCPSCFAPLRDLEGFVACDPCGKVWSTPDLSLVSAPAKRYAKAEP